jgi:simple sugar transport system permease protein
VKQVETKSQNLKDKIIINLNENVFLIISTFLSIFLGLVVSGLLMLLMDHNPIEAYKLIIEFAFIDSYNIANIFAKATPLILTALAFGFAFQAKLFNIGAQGQFYIGSIAAVFISLKFGSLPSFFVISFSLLFSLLAGGLWASLIGYFKAKFNANEFLVSMMSTYVAIAVMDYLVRGPLQESKGEYPQTNVIADSAKIPAVISRTQFHYGFFISIFVVLLIYILLWHTRLGFQIRAVGQNRDAARYAGFSEKKIFVIVFMICGALAALAGFMQVNGINHMVIQGFEPNIGATGIGVAILGNANPFGIVLAALLFSTMEVGGLMLTQTSTLPSSIIGITQGLVVIFVVISYYINHKFKVLKAKKKLIKGDEN